VVRGRYGLLLVIFAILVWVARWWDLGELRQISPTWFQVISLLFCLGLAACAVGALGRYWEAVQRGQ
jgi:hypothetical protein